MNFSDTYLGRVLIGIDDLGAAILANRNDCSISSLCRLAQMGKLEALKLSAWQVFVLEHLAPILDRLQPNHCELARQGDIERGKAMIALLDVAPDAK